MNSDKKEFLRGLRSGIPVLIGFLPIATTFSLMAGQCGMNKLETNAMSIMVLAGASQMMATQMMATGSHFIQIIIAVFFLNLRHFVMSTCVMERIKKTPLPLKLLLAFGVTDESFAIYSTDTNPNPGAAFFGGVSLMTYFSWVFGTLFGVLLIQIIPAGICARLVVALYVMFIGMIAPDMIKSLPIFIVVLYSMGINSLLSIWLNSSTSLVIAMLSGAMLGAVLEEWFSNKKKEHAL